MVFLHQRVRNVFQFFDERILSLLYSLFLVLNGHRDFACGRPAYFITFVVNILNPMDQVCKIEKTEGHVTKRSFLNMPSFYMIFADDKVRKSEGG